MKMFFPVSRQTDRLKLHYNYKFVGNRQAHNYVIFILYCVLLLLNILCLRILYCLQWQLLAIDIMNINIHCLCYWHWILATSLQ